jgi:hypothetical protein
MAWFRTGLSTAEERFHAACSETAKQMPLTIFATKFRDFGLAAW